MSRAQTVPMPTLPPESSHYKLGDWLGVGASARVVEARCPVSERDLALKLARQPGEEPRLMHQFRSTAGLRHANLAGYEGLTRLDDGALALVMERVRGLPCTQLGARSREARQKLALQLCRGVAVLHAWGALHGDLSPSNALVEDEALWIIDYGGAPQAGYGTPGYVAPEVLKGAPVSTAGDVYSLGCLVFEMLTGHPREAASLSLDRTPPPVESAAFGESVGELLAAALAPRPEARPSAAEVLESLAEAFGQPVDPGASMALALLSSPTPAALPPDLERLRAGLDGLRGGRGGVLELWGPRGSGRSYTLDVLAERAALAGHVPVRVDLRGGGTATDALARALGAQITGARDPVLALGRRLTALAEQRARVVLVNAPEAAPEDLHVVWEALQTAARLTPVMGVLVAASKASADAAPLQLPSLQAADRSRLLEGLLGTDIPGRARIVAWIERAAPSTHGELFELLRALARNDSLQRRGGRWHLARRLPPASTLLRPQAHAARGQEARVLVALGVLDRRVRPAELARVAGMSEPRLNQSIAALAAAGVVRRDGRGEVTLLQRGSLAGLPDANLTAMHAAAAELPMDELDFATRALERGVHRALAGAPTPLSDGIALARELALRRRFERAARVLRATAAQAKDNHARQRLHLEGARLELAWGHVDRARAMLVAQRADATALRTEQAELLGRCGAHREAIACLEGTEGSAAALALGRARLWNGERKQAMDLACGLLDAGTLRPELKARAAYLAATAGWQCGRAPEAEARALEGLAHCGADRAQRADLFLALGAARFYRGQMEAARDALAEAMTENRALGRLPELAKCLNCLAMVDLSRGHWGRAAETWEEFRLLCGRVGDPIELANASNNVGYMQLRLGKLHRAVSAFRRCIEIAEAAGFKQLVPVALGNLGEALMRLGEFPRAATAFKRARPGSVAPGLFELDRRCVELQLLRGEVEAARQSILRLSGTPAWDPAGGQRAELDRLHSICHRLQGRPEAAQEFAKRALEYFITHEAAYEAASCREEYARALDESGSTLEASREAAAATDAYLAMGAQAHADRTGALYRDLVRRASAERRRSGGQRALLEIAQHLGGAREIEALLPLVLDRAVQIVEAERGFFALYDEGRLARGVAHGLEWPGLPAPPPVSHRVLEQVMETGVPVMVQDVETEGEYGGRHSVRLLGLRSMIGVPVTIGDRVRGVIYVDSRSASLTNLHEESELLTAFAGLVGISLENADLMEAMHFRNHLLGTMAHDFRTPLGVLLTNLHGFERLEAEDRAEVTSDMVSAGVRMTRMIDDTLELARGEAVREPAPPQRLDVAEAVGDHLRGLRGLAESSERGLSADFEPQLPPLVTRPERLWIVIDNLVFNAIKYAPQGTEVKVSVRLRPDIGGAARPPSRADLLFRGEAPLRAASGSPFVEFTVQNGGPAIAPELFETLFEPFRRGGASKGGVKSTGLGLAIVERCVSRLGGRVWVRSDAEEGTRFVFTLPTRLVGVGSEKTPLSQRNEGGAV